MKRKRSRVATRQRFLLLALGGVVLTLALFFLLRTSTPPVSTPNLTARAAAQADKACRDIQDACKNKPLNDAVCAAAKPPVC